MGIKQLVRKHKGPLLLLVVVLLANILLVSGTFKSNPADYYSGIAVNVTGSKISGQPTIDPNSAYATQALGRASAEQLIHGHMPWWNSYEQVGAPLAGEMQSAALFLPFNLLFFLPGGIFLFHLTLEFIGALCLYYLLKRLGCKERVALIGGALFAINGTFAWMGAPNVNPIAFLPMLLLGIEIAFAKAKKSEKRGWVIIALALALSLYAGFPEVAYIDGLLAGVWFLVRAVQIRHGPWRSFTGKTLLGVGVGILLAAPILIAFKEYLPYANVGDHGGSFATYSLPLLTLPGLFMPYVYGAIFSFSNFDPSGLIVGFWDNIGGFITLTLVFLAVVSLFSRNRSNRILRYALAGWSLMIVARSYGVPGVSNALNLIPGIRLVAFYRYSTPTLELAVIVLAALGLEMLLVSKKEDIKRGITVAGAACAGIIAFCTVLALKEDHRLYLAPHHHLWLLVSVAWSTLTVAALIVTMVYFRRYAKVLLPAIILFDAVLMFMVPHVSAPQTSTLDTNPIRFLQQNLGTQRFYSINALMPNYGSYYGIAAINTNNLPVPKAWTDYITHNLNANVNPLIEFTGVNQLDPKGITPLQAFFKNMPSYEYVGVKYVFVGKNVIPQADAEAHGLKLVFADDYYQIYQLPNPKPYYQLLTGDCELQTTSRTSVSIQCAIPSTVQRSELYMPGWTATSSGGKNLPITKHGSLFQSVSVPAGKSTITFHYAPPHSNEAMIAFVAGVLILVGLYAPVVVSREKWTQAE